MRCRRAKRQQRPIALTAGPAAVNRTQQNRADERPRSPIAGMPTNSARSRVSGGGGERDVHHTHNPFPPRARAKPHARTDEEAMQKR